MHASRLRIERNRRMLRAKTLLQSSAAREGEKARETEKARCAGQLLHVAVHLGTCSGLLRNDRPGRTWTAAAVVDGAAGAQQPPPR